MNILVRCEDHYGCNDIILYSFGIAFPTDYKQNTVEVDLGTDKIVINSALSSSGVFRFNSDMTLYDEIIFVYDMDKGVRDRYNYMSHATLLEQIKDITSKVKGEKLKFAPTVFCNETMLLHKQDPHTLDFSKIFGKFKTSVMHKAMIYDIISVLFPKSMYPKMWNNRNSSFMIKTTRNYIHSGYSMEDMVNALATHNYSDFNMPFLKWVTSGNIHDTKYLLNVDQAINQQMQFEVLIKAAIASGNTGVNYNGKFYDN